MNRTQRAEAISMRARVFVRRAREKGCTNTITELLLAECADALGFDGEEWSLRTAKSITRRECRKDGEADLIAF